MKDPLDLPITRPRADALVAASALTPAEGDTALELAAAPPSGVTWGRFLDRALLAAGTMLVVVGVVFFVAYDWHALHRFEKLGLLATLFVSAVAAAIVLGESALGRASLFAATVLIGALLAVFGQVYQTGADGYALFGAWALLAAPMVAVSRTAPTWIAELLVIDVAIALYVDVHATAGASSIMALALALPNVTAWIASEIAVHRGVAWLGGRATSRVLCVLAYLPCLAGAIEVVVEVGEGVHPAAWLTALLFAFVAAGTAYAHARVRRDVFTLTVLAAGLLVVFGTALARFLFDALDLEEGGALLEGLALLGAVALAVTWLRAEALAGAEDAA